MAPAHLWFGGCYSGPVEEEREITRLCVQELWLLEYCYLGELSALLARSELYLGNDSGVSHLAAALGVVTAVLFGPSNVARWSPQGKNVTILTQNTECSPCTVSTMKNCPHRKCLTTLEPEYVITKLAGLVAHLDKGGG